MELRPHLDAVRADLAAAAAVGGPDVASAAGRIAEALEPALRLALLDLLAEAAEDLTAQLGGMTVDVRLRGREPELVVTQSETVEAAPAADTDDAGTARITLRLPEGLKSRAESAAAAEGLSANSWLVRAVAAALEPRPSFPFAAGASGPRRLTGYGRA